MGIRFIAVILTAALLSCSDPVIGPSPPPPASTTTTTAKEPPPPFSWDRFQGFSAFALFAHDEATRESTIHQAMAFGWNTPRVCAETEWWEGSFYFPRVLRDTLQLRYNLDHLTSIPGVQVLLIANCTYKHNASDADQLGWMNAVANVAKDYPNVAVEVVNEYEHPYYNVGEPTVIEAIRYARSIGIQEVGADSGVCHRNARLDHPLLRWVTFPSFHPCRTKGQEPWDPPVSFLRDLVNANRGFAVLSETVAYDDSGLECEDGLRTCDQDRIQRYVDNCARVAGCKFTFHSMAGLRGADYTFFPNAK